MEEYYSNASNSTKWVDIYRPSNIQDIVGNKFAVNDIKDWLLNYNTHRDTYMKTKSNSGGKGKSKAKSKIKESSITATEDISMDSVDICDMSDIGYTGDMGYTGDIGDIGDMSIDIAPRKVKNHKYHSCMTVSGSHGIGKTCSVIAILQSLDYTVNIVNFTKIIHTINPQEFATKMLHGNNIFNIVSREKSKKIAIVIDDLESITSPIELKFIDTLIKENDIVWRYPIVFITNNRHKRFINNIKLNTFEVRMALPTEKQLEYVLSRVCFMNKMVLTSQDIARKIIDHAQYDYRRLLTTLQDLYNIYNKKEITEECIYKYFEFSKRKDIDIDIYKSTESLLSDKTLNIEDRLIAYETERTILPLMVHQNHIGCINRYIAKNKQYKLANKLTEYIAKGDVIENYIYGDQNWSLQETHGFYTCVLPTHIISNNINANNMANDINYKSFRMEFPLDLNRTSIKHINVKNVKNAAKDFPDMDISDFIYVKTILKKLLEEERYDEYKKILSGHNATPEGIKAVIKVDKILDTKTNIPTSMIRKIGVYT
jgi:hypothetical protein